MTLENVSWHWRRTPKHWFVITNAFFANMPYLTVSEPKPWAWQRLCWLKSRVNQMQRSHSWVIHGPPDLLLAWQTVQIKWILCSLYRQNWRFQPRFPSLTCSELKQNVNSESTNNVMGFEQRRRVATIALLLCVTKLHQCLQKVAQAWIKSGSAGQPVLSVSFEHKHTQAPRLPPCLMQTCTAFIPHGTVLNNFQY